MSKQTDDLIDRIQGAVVALRSVRGKLSPPAPPEGAVPPPPNPEVAQEDYEYAKKVIAELKGQIETLEAEVARESKVPESAPAGSAGEKSKTKI